MKRFFHLLSSLSISLLAYTSCTSLYLEEFDTPVHEGVKNYSLTDLERNIVEMPGDKQDVLIGIPGLVTASSTPCLSTNQPICPTRVWICDKVCSNGEIEEGHYKVFTNGEENDSF